MKNISNKFWEFFFFKIMGVEFITDSPDFLVKKPIGLFMCEQSVIMGDLVKIETGRYKFNNPVNA